MNGALSIKKDSLEELTVIPQRSVIVAVVTVKLFETGYAFRIDRENPKRHLVSTGMFPSTSAALEGAALFLKTLEVVDGH